MINLTLRIPLGGQKPVIESVKAKHNNSNKIKADTFQLKQPAFKGHFKKIWHFILNKLTQPKILYKDCSLKANSIKTDLLGFKTDLLGFKTDLLGFKTTEEQMLNKRREAIKSEDNKLTQPKILYKDCKDCGLKANSIKTDLLGLKKTEEQMLNERREAINSKDSETLNNLAQLMRK